MSRIVENQLRLVLGNYTNFEDFMNKRTVVPSPFGTPNSLTLASPANVKILDAPTHLAADIISKGAISAPSNASNSGGLVTAALAGAVGTGAITGVTDTSGNILNLVDLKESGTNDDVVVNVGGLDRKVYGLIQSSSTVTDGDAIGSSGSENVQISFVYYDGSYALALTNLPAATYDFQINKLYAERNLPAIRKEGGSVSRDVLDLGTMVDNYLAVYEVTTDFPATDIWTLSTGDGTTGVSTASGDNASIAFPTTSAEFNTNARVIILRNGIEQVKGTGKDVVYNSSTGFHFTAPLYVGETIMIKTPVVYN